MTSVVKVRISMQISIAQIASTADIAANLEKVEAHAREAKQHGSDVVVFPEGTMLAFGNDLLPAATDHSEAWREDVQRLSTEIGINIVLGEFMPGAEGKVRNALAHYRPELGREHYEKIHLFDAFAYAESDSVDPGGEILVSEVAGVPVGFAVCYDLRFPKLFAELSRAGAKVCILIASWGDGPGKAEQWETLIRARALDSNTFVVGVGQARRPNPQSLVPGGPPLGVGRSVVSDPYGKVLLRLGEVEETATITLDPARADQAQRDLPVLVNAKLGY